MVPGATRAKKQLMRRDRHEFAAEQRATAGNARNANKGEANKGKRTRGSEQGEANKGKRTRGSEQGEANRGKRTRGSEQGGREQDDAKTMQRGERLSHRPVSLGAGTVGPPVMKMARRRWRRAAMSIAKIGFDQGFGFGQGFR
jgi:hypothetical protein